MPQLEGDLKEEILEILRAVPYSTAVKVAGSKFQESGLPYIFFTCRDLGGRAVWIELKKPGEKARKLQEYKIRRLRRAGAVAVVVDSVKEVWMMLDDLGVRRVA